MKFKTKVLLCFKLAHRSGSSNQENNSVRCEGIHRTLSKPDHGRLCSSSILFKIREASFLTVDDCRSDQSKKSWHRENSETLCGYEKKEKKDLNRTEAPIVKKMVPVCRRWFCFPIMNEGVEIFLNVEERESLGTIARVSSRSTKALVQIF